MKVGAGERKIGARDLFGRNDKAFFDDFSGFVFNIDDRQRRNGRLPDFEIPLEVFGDFVAHTRHRLCHEPPKKESIQEEGNAQTSDEGPVHPLPQGGDDFDSRLRALRLRIQD